MVLIDFLNKAIPGEGGGQKKFSRYVRNLAPTLAKILCTHLLPSLLYPFHFPTIFIYIVSNIILCIFFYKHLPVSSPTLSLYSPYPFQYHHCILPILSIPYLYPPYPFQYHPFSSLYVSYHFQYYPCILPHTSIFSYTLYIQVYNIHQSVHNHTPLPPYPFQYHPCILTIYISFPMLPYIPPMAFPISACMDSYPLPISSLYSPYILSDIILVFSLYPFQYHPCILMP